MSIVGSAMIVLTMLLAGAMAGLFVQPLLSDAHRSPETRELSQAVTGMLVTLAALVLGLLTNSVKQSFDAAEGDLRGYATALIELDQTLRNFGSEAQDVRLRLRTYVASAIASTWPEEPRPAGAETITDANPPAPHLTIESETLGNMLNKALSEFRQLPVDDRLHSEIAAIVQQQFGHLMDGRWKLLEDAHSSIPLPFYRVLEFWLLIVFATLGLIAPRNLLALALIVLAAVAIASVIFAIMEMDTPFTGLITVSSAPMRDALAHLSE
jgi:hypothetical protein